MTVPSPPTITLAMIRQGEMGRDRKAGEDPRAALLLHQNLDPPPGPALLLGPPVEGERVVILAVVDVERAGDAKLQDRAAQRVVVGRAEPRQEVAQVVRGLAQVLPPGVEVGRGHAEADGRWPRLRVGRVLDAHRVGASRVEVDALDHLDRSPAEEELARLSPRWARLPPVALKK